MASNYSQSKLTEPEKITESAPVVNRKRLIIFGLAALIIGIALYFTLPRIAGLQRSLEVLRHMDPFWVGAAVICTIASFASYVFLYGGIIGGRFLRDAPKLRWSTAYELSMASLGATTVITAGGAGGIAFTLWVLHTAKLRFSSSVRRVTAFLIMLYSVYLGALIVCGVLLAATDDDVPFELTLLPAIIATLIVTAFLFLTIVLKGKVHIREHQHMKKWWHRFQDIPQILADSTRLVISLMRDRRGGPRAIGFAIGYWVFNVAVLWVLFRGFGKPVPVLVLVQAFFIGMTASLIPLLPGGVGSIDAGLVGAFIAFGLPAAETVLAVLSYRMITFWLPTIPELVAYIRLQRKINRRAPELQLT